MCAVMETRKVVTVPEMNTRTGGRTMQYRAYRAAGSMIWGRYLLIVAALAVALGMSCAHGAHITMATQFSVTQEADGLTLAVTVQNRGNVPAHAVQVEASVEGESLVGPVFEKLAVHESASVAFGLVNPFQQPGRYPLVIRTFYKDAAGHRFTALVVGFYNHDTANTPNVFINGQAATVPVDGRGRAVFVLRNKGSGMRTVDLELHLPEELSATRRRAVVELAPASQDSVVFDLENFSGLLNSRYPVTLVGRFEHDGYSYAVAGTATVQIGNESTNRIKPTWIWFVLAGLLPLVMVLLRLQSRRVSSRAR